VWQWELDILLGVLHTIGTLQVLVRNNTGTDNLNGSGTSAVSSGHFIVELRDGSSELHVPEFAVHVMGTRTGGITQPDSKILDKASVLLADFDTVKDFTGSLLHLTELVHVVPELGLSNDSVWGKDDHAVGLWVRVFLSGSLSADHLVLFHHSGDSHISVKTRGYIYVSIRYARVDGRYTNPWWGKGVEGALGARHAKSHHPTRHHQFLPNKLHFFSMLPASYCRYCCV